MSCSNILKNAVGIVGVIIILSICIIPIIKLTTLMAVYYLGSALCQPIADDKIVKLLGQIGGTFKLLLAIMCNFSNKNIEQWSDDAMIEFLSSWAQGIIVAVIIATLIEMILPNSSSKKYVKVVIGMYILFTIVSPIIKKLGGKDINLNTINIEKYERQISKSDNTISRKFEDNNTRSIKDIYVSNLKADISAKLKEKGYEIDTSDVQIKDDENYTIEKITLKLIKMEQKQEKNNEIVINTVEIGNTISQKDSKTLSDDEKQEVKDYISETYDIDKKNINIS